MINYMLSRIEHEKSSVSSRLEPLLVEGNILNDTGTIQETIQERVHFDLMKQN